MVTERHPTDVNKDSPDHPQKCPSPVYRLLNCDRDPAYEVLCKVYVYSILNSSCSQWIVREGRRITMRRATVIAACLLVAIAAASCSGTATVAVENMHSMIRLQLPTPNDIYPSVQVTVNGEVKYLGNLWQ